MKHPNRPFRTILKALGDDDDNDGGRSHLPGDMSMQRTTRGTPSLNSWYI
jgi:hypothetical protein